MPDPLVIHCKRAGSDVYIGRPSKWGNPFVIGGDGDHTHVIECHERWLDREPQLLAQVRELAGKALGSWCTPKRCHGGVLARRAREASGSREPRGASRS